MGAIPLSVLVRADEVIHDSLGGKFTGAVPRRSGKRSRK
jgi:hypothetical protein